MVTVTKRAMVRVAGVIAMAYGRYGPAELDLYDGMLVGPADLVLYVGM